MALSNISTLASWIFVFIVCTTLWYRRRSRIPIAHVPGPTPESFWLGNLRQLMREQVGDYDLQWQNNFGMVVRFKAPLGGDRLWISDPKAIQYILQTSRYHFVKPYAARFVLNTATGKGVNGAEGKDHYRQRRVLLPAFGGPESRALRPIFRDSAEQLVQQFRNATVAGDATREVDVPVFLGRAVLHALGRAAFAYDFSGIDEQPDALAESLHNFMALGFGLPSDWKVFLQGVMAYVPPPILDLMAYVPTSGLTFLRRHVRLSNDIARILVCARAGSADGRDALSLIIRANASEDESRRLTDAELLPQLATILGAGHETTTNTLGWILLELARHPDAQKKLRDEIRSARAEAADVNLDTLPYLNAVIKETLRFDTVVPHLFRVSTRDDVIPVSAPISSPSGDSTFELPIPKGTQIIISDVAYNRNKDIWGADADVWRPERWLEQSDGDAGHANTASMRTRVGVLGNLMSFGSGHRACLGWRFAMVEVQEFTAELVAHLRVEMTPRAERVRRENCLVMLPMVEGEAAKGNQLPLRLSFVD
ncbi:cytochrome P450 [Artomyces pyxidatus]|uniref:Cytochrome P450 n=1 Tax=Artomyces pyxidatus TaxID=48021 RepID=A0ACB8TEV0_9AGAM|nr:cytochrome P450 [Artomyces pyxidatus]